MEEPRADELQTYEPVMEAKNIIATLVENMYNDIAYQSHLSDMEEISEVERKKASIIKRTITDIKIFNTNTNPLFLARDIGILMGITHINSLIKNYNKSEKVMGYVVQNGKLKQRCFLTRHGVYRALMNARSKLSEVFRGFIYKLLDHMQQYELEKFKGIIAEFTKENPILVEQSLIELHDNFTKYKLLYEVEKREHELWKMKAIDVSDKLSELELEKTHVEMENAYNESYINQLKKNNHAALDKLSELDNNCSDHEPDELTTLKKKFMKDVNIYIVKPDYVKKVFKSVLSGVGTPSLHGEDASKYGMDETYSCIEYENEYKFVVHDFEKCVNMVSDRILYYYLVYRGINEDRIDIPKYTHLATEWVYDKNTYLKLLQILKTECTYHQLNKKGGISNFMFKTSYDHIKSIVNSFINDGE